MGLFSKKKIPDGIRVLFYDGELPGFSVNGPCQVLLMGSVLRITRVDPYTEVRLDRTQITEIEIYFREQEYMAKYHGVSVSTSRMRGVEKQFYVINYLDKEGKKKHLSFWGTASETGKIMKLQKDIQEKQKPISYEI